MSKILLQYVITDTKLFKSQNSLKLLQKESVFQNSGKECKASKTNFYSVLYLNAPPMSLLMTRPMSGRV